ncbi:hypothetical protein [Kibdelosporangium philippinense]
MRGENPPPEETPRLVLKSEHPNGRNARDTARRTGRYAGGDKVSGHGTYR